MPLLTSTAHSAAPVDKQAGRSENVASTPWLGAGPVLLRCVVCDGRRGAGDPAPTAGAPASACGGSNAAGADVRNGRVWRLRRQPHARRRVPVCAAPGRLYRVRDHADALPLWSPRALNGGSRRRVREHFSEHRPHSQLRWDTGAAGSNRAWPAYGRERGAERAQQPVLRARRVQLASAGGRRSRGRGDRFESDEPVHRKPGVGARDEGFSASAVDAAHDYGRQLQLR